MGKSTRDNRDLYYRSAKQEGWRARSAFKLLNLDRDLKGKLFNGVKRAVDLCAAPGSWSQVLSQKIYLPNQSDPDVKIVAVDFQFMVPIPGVIQLQGDITQVSTAERILAEFQGEKADLVVCDGAPDVTGFHDLDVYRHHDIVTAALAITTAILKDDGILIMKVFKKKNDDLLGQQIATFFREVAFAKPEGSRDSSLEHFAVCSGHFCPLNYQPRMLLDYFASGTIEPFRNTKIPFVIYGETNSNLFHDKELEREGFDGQDVESQDAPPRDVVRDVDLLMSSLKLNGDRSENEPFGQADFITDAQKADSSIGTNQAASLDSAVEVASVADKFVWKSLFPPLQEYMKSLTVCDP